MTKNAMDVKKIDQSLVESCKAQDAEQYEGDRGAKAFEKRMHWRRDIGRLEEARRRERDDE